ncbi:MAG: DsbA family oxidoreductase [Leptospirales bacterium]|nr:DsbA family oxidoreductase [Leptospirales bacterium]
MKIEIWSDIMCPFCYIGKRRFEEALKVFPKRNEVEIQWKSFQLDPGLASQPGKDVYTYLAEIKGQTREWSIKMHEGVVQTAKEVGLDYRFDRAVIANSFDAHRLIQMAKKHNLGDAAEERLFHAYFTEGKDVANLQTLAELGAEIGLDSAQVSAMLESDEFRDEVLADVDEARQLGARGVPFFVIDRKYAVYGAQHTATFLQALEASAAESA